PLWNGAWLYPSPEGDFAVHRLLIRTGNGQNMAFDPVCLVAAIHPFSENGFDGAHLLPLGLHRVRVDAIGSLDDVYERVQGTGAENRVYLPRSGPPLIYLFVEWRITRGARLVSHSRDVCGPHLPRDGNEVFRFYDRACNPWLCVAQLPNPFQGVGKVRGRRGHAEYRVRVFHSIQLCRYGAHVLQFVRIGDYISYHGEPVAGEQLFDRSRQIGR